MSTSSPHVLITSNILYTNVVVISWVPSDFMIKSSVSLAALFNALSYTTALLTVDRLSLVVAPVDVDAVAAVVVVSVAVVHGIEVWFPPPQLVCLVLPMMNL